MNKLDIIIIAKNDYANVGYLYAKALKSVGVKAEAWAVHPSPRGYEKHANIFHALEEITPRVAGAKAVQLMHSRRFSAVPLKGKFVTIFHGGSRYRMRPERMNSIFNPVVDKSIIQTGDLLNLGARNEVWVLPCINTKEIQSDFNRTDSKRVIVHYPHKSYVKGTEMIFDVLSEFTDNGVKCRNERGWKYLINDQMVPWEENLKRISGCDIYIEAVNPVLREKPYGEWGLTTLEAAALGKVVITHFLSWKRYAQEYGSCPLIVANNREEFIQALHKVLEMSNEEILNLKHETRAWVEKYHSLEAIGKRLMEKVYNGVFA